VTLIALDLDDTVMFSVSRWAGYYRHPRFGVAWDDPRPAVELVPAEAVVDVHDGRPVAFTPVEWQKSLVRAVSGPGIRFAVATARSTAQVARTTLFPPPRYAVLAAGALLLVDGEPDSDWSRVVATALEEAADARAVLELLGAADDDPRTQLREGALVVAAHGNAEAAAERLETLRGGVDDLGWVLEADGRRLYAAPRGVTKRAALARLAELLGEDGWFAAGDSALDRGMVEGAIGACVAEHGVLAPLADRGELGPHVVSARGWGPDAPWGILDWLGQIVRDRHPGDGL